MNATGTGTGGDVTILTSAPQSFYVGGGGSITNNGTFGNISANGLNGGFIISQKLWR